METKSLNFLSASFLAVISLVWPLKVEAGGYFCEVQAIGGVAYDEGVSDWVGSRFTPGKKILIEDKSEGGNARYIFTDLTLGEPYNICEEKFSADGILLCEIGLFNFYLYRNNMRFLEIYKAGFLNGKDEDVDTPYVAIGMCTEFP